jgi:hypothetical protein
MRMAQILKCEAQPLQSSNWTNWSLFFLNWQENVSNLQKYRKWVSLDIEVDRFSTSIKPHHWNIVENDVKHPKL